MEKFVYLRNVVTLNLDQGQCIGCGICLTVCPRAVLAMAEGRARIVDRDACMECGACMSNCPVDAIAVERGVGCAQAVINTMLGRTGEQCCTMTPAEGRGEPPARGRGTCG